MNRRPVVLALCAAALLAACSSSSGSKASGSSTAGGSTMTGPTATLVPPAGLPAFYGVPDPIPAGKPGDVIKTEKESVAGIHGTLERVMYHSQSVLGKDILVTGLIAIPSTPPPGGGYPVISWAHGTTGIADTCAPSLNPGDGDVQLANPLLDKGYEVVATDYEGLGSAGRHPYIAGISEARGVLDIVRAARNLPDARAGVNYLVWGHSQGGHAAMFSLHLADSYAPELHLVGVVAGAPPSQLLLINTALQKSRFRYYILMAAVGLNAAYGDAAAPLDQVLTPAGLAVVPLVDQGCAAELAKTVGTMDFSTLQKADPASVPAWRALLEQNDPGKFTAAAPEPLLIIQGGNDEQIPVVSTQLLFGQLCAIHQTVQRWVYPGQSHAGVIAPSLNDMTNWIGDRFAGKPAPDPTAPSGMAGIDVKTCPAAGPGG